MCGRFLLALAWTLLWFPLGTRAADWPQFRGPGGAGVASEEKLPTEWAADKNVPRLPICQFDERIGLTRALVKKALVQALAIKAKVSNANRDVQNQERALKEIEQDQARMRANLKEVPPTSDAYKRYVKKFDEQETEIEKRQKELARLREVAEKEKKGYDEFLAGLSIDG